MRAERDESHPPEQLPQQPTPIPSGILPLARGTGPRQQRRRAPALLAGALSWRRNDGRHLSGRRPTSSAAVSHGVSPTSPTALPTGGSSDGATLAHKRRWARRRSATRRRRFVDPPARQIKEPLLEVKVGGGRGRGGGGCGRRGDGRDLTGRRQIWPSRASSCPSAAAEGRRRTRIGGQGAGEGHRDD
jgi:hypothetical protein